MQPACVQTAVKALNCPAVGWVTTTFASVNTLPPPTGTSATGPSTAPAAGALEGAEDGADVGAELVGVPLVLLVLQAASTGKLTPARPATAAPRRTVRRSVMSLVIDRIPSRTLTK
jgi:hypothetical protein